MAVTRGKKQPKKAPAADQSATQGISTRLKEKDNKEEFNPTPVEKKARTYIKRRVKEMQDYRTDLGIEKRWREADEEYIPKEKGPETKRKRFEQDQDTGRRSRVVPVGDSTQNWRNDTSAPTLLAKIQTAIGIIVDQQPEADLVALTKKYMATTDLAYALWKRNWSITDAKEQLKLTIFDGIKYGFMTQQTAPREICYDKRVLTFKDNENPENDRYEEKKVYWFKDVARRRMDPYRTWIDEMSRPYDPYSTNEAYYEIDMSHDAWSVEMQQYKNWSFVKRDGQVVRDEDGKKGEVQNPEDVMKRKDIVTLGFFESRHKDLFMIYAPKEDVVVYLGPMPNDDGYLSIVHSLWILRHSNSPYGVSLWEIIRQNKNLYDKMKNMTMDQLVLSIMKFGFFSGTSPHVGDGKIDIVPGQARQLTSSTGKPEVNWMEIPGPGTEAWQGLEKLADEMDDDSGISPTLEGDITGKTLGEVLHAKEGSLKRLKLPVENIAWLIEQDAYVTLSWMSQLYAIPTVMEFVSEEELRAYEDENKINHVELFGTKQPDDTIAGPYEAHFLPELALHLEDSKGELKQSKNSKWFQIGKDIKPSQLKWKGIFKVIPRSIIDSSQTLVKASKMEMFNLLVPLFAMPPELVAKSAEQIVKINEEDPKDWLPDSFLQYLEGAGQQDMAGIAAGLPGPTGAPTPPPAAPVPPGAPVPPEGAPAAGAAPAPAAPPIFVPGGAPPTMQAQAGTAAPQAQTVVPKSEAPGGRSLGLFGRRL